MNTPADVRPTLSVVMPNRNHAALLPRSLGALARQTRPPDEIIVVDDASTDDSRAVIRGFMARLPQLRLIENPERLGVVGALNRGLREAREQTIYCAAADDASDPELVATLLDGMAAHPTAALACAEARLISDDGAFLGFRPITLPRRRAGYVSPAEAARMLARLDNWVLSVVTVYRRDLVMAAGGFDPRLGALCDSFLARVLALEHGFVFVPRVLGTWNVQPASVSRSASTDPAVVEEMVRAGSDRIAADGGRVFPPGYGPVFCRRLRFAAARLAVEAPRFEPARVAALAGVSPRVVEPLARLPPRLRRLAALGWLALRLRPMAPLPLLASAAIRMTRGKALRRPG